MKLTKLALGLVLVSLFSTRSVDALVPVRINPNLKILPTATPTLAIKPLKNVTLRLLPSAKPSITPTSTPEATVTLTTITEKPTPTITETPTKAETITATAVQAKPSSTDDMSKWFLVITVGLLTLIIVVQAWPEKIDKDQE